MKNRIRNILLEATAFKDRSNINDAFWKWFGLSEVRKNGEPLVMYHGTDRDFDKFSLKHFNTSAGGGDFGWGHYFTSDPHYASGYANWNLPFDDDVWDENVNNIRNTANFSMRPQIMPVYLRAKTLYRIGDELCDRLVKYDFLDSTKEWDGKKWTKELRRNGFDGVVNHSVYGFKEVVVFRPQQIKSVFNQGTWNPKSADIME